MIIVNSHIGVVILLLCRMVREDKSTITWVGMVVQTVWRFSMLSARIIALVLISLTLHSWVALVLGTVSCCCCCLPCTHCSNWKWVAEEILA